MLSKEEIDHVAELARLHVDDSEYELYGKQLYDILSEIEKIESVDVEGETKIMISPCTNINEYSNDSIGPMLSKEDILKNVKHSNGDYIVVPTVINE
ncbi:MAG: Asp-tRNA(Asn)/Glu-tRNA(Gln) amidotransferase subunit GatC [Bacilli bacterium]|nr:Asp-tRNA(Asn)/Glu-tRNA(Gln) amidotransferase subunit GatC [Bacilli bacterium]